MSPFEIDVVNYFEKKNPVVEIYYDHMQWAEISQEDNALTIKFYTHPQQEDWKFSCQEAEAVIEEAKGKFLAAMNRINALFPTAGEPEEANRIGQELLEEILNNPNSQVLKNRFGGVDIFHPSGRGARFNKKQEFLGFLQLR